ncbi:ORFB [Mastadenovirus pipistrelli]|uniref:Uncharacterized protein n=1 Tax=Bat mastadenovirus TaxID=740971 RepID=A0A894JHZ7_9ADEN|nr:ORFB [Bat mastadenovirus B]QRV11601.1 hypothetical protein [Bat mastadenovirus]
MASAVSRVYYECNIEIRDALAAVIKEKDYETDLCRGVSMLLQTTYNLMAVRRLSSHSSYAIESSIVFASLQEMPCVIRAEVQTMVRVYIRGWIEGLGAGLEEDLYTQWLNNVTVNFFNC